MTSVQSLLRRLSGNSIIVFSLIFLLGSCSIFKKTGRDPYQEENAQLDPNNEVEDTRDTIIEEINISDEDEDIDPSQYVWDDGKEDILIVLPFNSYAHTMDGSHSFVLHFYSGLKRGFETSQTMNGRPLSIRVRDSRGFNTEMKNILSGIDSTNTDLIIGGFSKNNIESICNISAELSIPYLSPIFPSGKMSRDNPYHMQVTPDFDSHCNRLLEHIKRHHSTANIQFLSRNTSAEKRRVLKLSEMWSELNPGAEELNEEHQIMVEWEDENSEFNLLGKFEKYNANVFIIPSWSSESFVYSALRQISIDKRNADVIVYGMPQWRSFELSSYDYYEDLSLRITSAASIDNVQDKERIKKTVYNEFNYISTEKELLAYATGNDIGKYIGKLIRRYGQSWMDYVDKEKFVGMAVNFDFERTQKEKLLVSEQASPGALENQSVRILEFENYKFRVIED